MPLLRRQPFVRQKPPSYLDPEEEIFYCKLTNEIFRDYEEFFERIILCNSLVWTCSITGRPSLTYQEAVESEEKAKKRLSSFPEYLQRPILYLSTLTHRSRLADMNDDVFVFARNRYFIGEVVEVSLKGGEKKSCRIVRVIPPKGVEALVKSPGKSPAPALTNGNAEHPIEIPDSSEEDDVICLDDDGAATAGPSTPKKTAQEVDSKSPIKDLEKTKAMGADPTQYQYVVQETRKAATMYTVKYSQISRKKGLFTRDKTKLYLKQYCDSQGDGVWKVKARMIKKFKLNEAKFEDYFTGPRPAFAVSKVKKKPRANSAISEDDLIKQAKRQKKEMKKEMKAREKEEKKRKKQEEKRMKKEEKVSQVIKESPVKMTPEQMAELKEKWRLEKLARTEELKKRKEEEKQRKKEEREKEREKKKEEKREREEYLKEWSKPREDMECDDLKDLPVPTPVQTCLSSELFGDLVMILEYLNDFKELYDLSDQFPGGIQLDALMKSIQGSDNNGLFMDLLKYLLTAIFSLQEEEDQEVDEEDEELDPSAMDSMPDVTHSGASYKDMVRRANLAVQWPLLYHGCGLRKLNLDSFTITEILRLHFLSSGAEGQETNKMLRFQERGGFTSLDDAGLEFCRNEPEVMKALQVDNVFDMEPGYKLRLLRTLVQQLMTFAACRDHIEENQEALKQVRIDLRQLQVNEVKRERDEQTFWYKKRLEERAKEREAENEKKAQKKKEREDRLRYDELKKKAKTEGVSEEEDKELELLDLELKKQEMAKALEKAKKEIDQKKSPEKSPDKPVEEEERRTRRKLIDEVKAEAEKAPERKSSRQKEAKQKELQVEDIPIENIDWEKVTVEEKERWRAKHAEKEREYMDSIMRLQCGSAIYPIGRDRTFRRFWVLKSVPGLLVEDQEEHVEVDFLYPVAQDATTNPFQSGTGSLQVSPKSEEKAGSSDKENEAADSALARSAGAVRALGLQPENNQTGAAKVDSKSETPMDVDIENEAVQMISVHEQIADRGKARWAFYNTKAQVDKLLESLNPRGLREGSLKQAILENKRYIYDCLEKCPSGILCSMKEEEDDAGGKAVKMQSLKTSRGRTTQGKVTNSSAQEFMELNLRESLLDLEERIYCGTLGAIKVKDRAAWRAAIERGNFDKQSDMLSWSGKKEDSESNGEEVIMSASLCDSRMVVDDDDDASPVVKDLAMALLQVAQGMEEKYLMQPLGEDEDTKKKKQKAALEAAFKGFSPKKKTRASREAKEKSSEDSSSSSESEEEGEEQTDARLLKTPMERWEESLMSCTSLAQIFLYLSTLDKSITWTKSALHARCRLCRRKGDPEKMLLCDGCDRGHHMYCLKPQVKHIPSGDWYCPDCRPKDVVRTPRKQKRKVVKEVEEESDSDEEEEDSDEDGVEQLESSDEEADSDDEDDSDDDDSDEDDSSESEEEEEEDSPVTKVKMQAIKRPSRSGRSTPRSGRSTPNLSRSRGQSPRDSPEPGRAKRGRESTGKTSTLVTSSRRSTEPAKSSRKSVETDRRTSKGRVSLERPNSRAGKRRASDTEDEPTAKKPVSKSRANEQVNNMKMCEDLVNKLIDHDDSWPFIKPVTRKQAPDYFNIVKKPMDFSTMKSKINKYEYMEPAEILEDVRLIFRNCEQYNLDSAPEFACGKKMSKFFEKKLKELHLDSLLKNGPSKGSPANKKGKK